MRHNTILSNNQVCPPDEGPPFSGIGIALAGAHDVTIQSNVIQGNGRTGPTFADGGVVVADQGPGTTAPMNNKVSNNVITRNATDIIDNGTGSGNEYKNNICGANPARAPESLSIEHLLAVGPVVRWPGPTVGDRRLGCR